ncbi:putative transposase [Citrobacter werkmanii NBRC 105721]|nr:putative transposase [Citrobacter werkmanii NBRC 105721]
MHASQAGAVSGFSIQGRSQILSLNITLSSYPKQNGLAKALREISCIELTLCMPDWLRDPALRRRVQPGLNKGESPNALARAVFMHRLGIKAWETRVTVPAGLH